MTDCERTIDGMSKEPEILQLISEVANKVEATQLRVTASQCELSKIKCQLEVEEQQLNEKMAVLYKLQAELSAKHAQVAESKEQLASSLASLKQRRDQVGSAMVETGLAQVEVDRLAQTRRRLEVQMSEHAARWQQAVDGSAAAARHRQAGERLEATWREQRQLEARLRGGAALLKVQRAGEAIRARWETLQGQLEERRRDELARQAEVQRLEERAAAEERLMAEEQTGMAVELERARALQTQESDRLRRLEMRAVEFRDKLAEPADDHGHDDGFR